MLGWELQAAALSLWCHGVKGCAWGLGVKAWESSHPAPPALPTQGGVSVPVVFALFHLASSPVEHQLLCC